MERVPVEHDVTEELGRKLSVLFVVSEPTSSPAISVHANLMRFLDRDRVDVHVLYNRLAAAEPYRSDGSSVLDVLPGSPDVKLRPAEFGPVGRPRTLRQFAGAVRSLAPALRDGLEVVGYVRRNGIDVIHCEYGARNGTYGFVISRLTRAKYIVHFHSKYGSWMSRLSRFAVRQADAIVTVSSWTGRVIEQEAGVPAARIFPVLNGIDVACWDPSAVDGAGVRRELDLQSGDPLVVMVAQLTAWKRQTTAIEAFQLVAQTHPCARLLLVGKEQAAPSVHGAVSYTDRLRKLVAELGLERHVLFAGRRPDIREILAAADIFLLPSIDDPCPLAHIEAMAMAKPVVAVEAGGAPELVEHGKSGLLGPADDAGQVAANLIALIDDPGRRRELGDYGRRRALEQLNATRMADDVERVYRSLSASR
jgi:glycosyltransferase involved in cell wall biosynthesis